MPLCARGVLQTGVSLRRGGALAHGVTVRPSPTPGVTPHPHGVQGQPQVLLLHRVLRVFHQLLCDPETRVNQACPVLSSPGALQTSLAQSPHSPGS